MAAILRLCGRAQPAVQPDLEAAGGNAEAPLRGRCQVITDHWRMALPIALTLILLIGTIYAIVNNSLPMGIISGVGLVGTTGVYWGAYNLKEMGGLATNNARFEAQNEVLQGTVEELSEALTSINAEFLERLRELGFNVETLSQSAQDLRGLPDALREQVNRMPQIRERLEAAGVTIAQLTQFHDQTQDVLRILTAMRDVPREIQNQSGQLQANNDRLTELIDHQRGLLTNNRELVQALAAQITRLSGVIDQAAAFFRENPNKRPSLNLEALSDVARSSNDLCARLLSQTPPEVTARA